MSSMQRVCLIGNPNAGKTTIFNALTGAHQSVGNWPGVTVEKKSGVFEKNNKKIEVVDLPGVYSLSVLSSDSEDEKIARDFLLFEKPDCIVNIVDASNLERNLYMTVQLLEMKLPVILVLNMTDVAEREKIYVNAEKLSSLLNIPVLSMVASKTKGIEALKSEIAEYNTKVNFDFSVAYSSEIENIVQNVQEIIQETADENGWDKRWLSVHLLDGDSDVRLFGSTEIFEKIEQIRTDFTNDFDKEPDTMVADGRYDLIATVAEKVIKRDDKLSQNVTEMIDKIALGRITGVPFFMLIMYLMFVWTINVGGTLIEPIAEFGDAFFVAKFGGFLAKINTPEFVAMLLTNGVGQAVSTVATFIPPIGFLFVFLAVLEDSGYMARGAFVMDRFMRSLNLPGTSFVPMIVAFGCTVPAVMGTRVLASRRERLLTLMMTPFMSCGARLPVYALFATVFFGASGSTVIFGLYLIGILFAFFTAFLFKSTVLKGEAEPLVLEIPAYHLPTIRNVLTKTWEKLYGFVVRAGCLIIPLVICLNILNSIDYKANLVMDTPEKSVLSSIGKTITPVFEPMGISQENWPATVGLFTGVLAKEALIGTLDTLYVSLDNEQENSTQRLVHYFDGKKGAFAYLLFVLMYVPCLAAMGAITKEFGLLWAGITMFWTTGQAYLVSTLFYQSALLHQGLNASLAWIASIVGIEILVVIALYFMAKNSKLCAISKRCMGCVKGRCGCSKSCSKG